DRAADRRRDDGGDHRAPAARPGSRHAHGGESDVRARHRRGGGGRGGGARRCTKPPQVEDARRERRGRPMLLIDLAVPRSIEPAVNGLDGVYLFDVDDLEGVVAENRGARASEAQGAGGVWRDETIVDAEVDAFWSWLQGLEVVPTIVALREHLEGIRQREVERHLSALGAVDPRQRDMMERVTRAIVNKILHHPVTTPRRHQAARGERYYCEGARALFRLGGDDPPDDEDP